MATHICALTAFPKLPKMLGRQILFEPLEEQLDLPSPFVDIGDSECEKIETIGEKGQMQTGFWIAERSAAQPLRIALLGLQSGQSTFVSLVFTILVAVVVA